MIKKTIFTTIIIGTVIMLLLKIGNALEQNKSMQLYFMDVGQGDAMVVETTKSNFGLIDSGKGDEIISELKRLFWPHECKFEFAMASHPDLDHIEGFLKIYDICDIKNLVIPGVEFSTEHFEVLLQKAKNSGSKIVQVKSGDNFKFDGIEFNIISPEFPTTANTSNNYSIGTKISFEKLSIITMGDLESEFEIKAVKKLADPDIDILKISHHGSKFSTSNELIELTTPAIAVISVGQNNPYNHPDTGVLEILNSKGIETLQTSINGSIRIYKTGDLIKWESF